MAFYNPDPSGLNEVTLPDGTRIKTALPPEQLQGYGYEPAPAPVPSAQEFVSQQGMPDPREASLVIPTDAPPTASDGMLAAAPGSSLERMATPPPKPSAPDMLTAAPGSSLEALASTTPKPPAVPDAPKNVYDPYAQRREKDAEAARAKEPRYAPARLVKGGMQVAGQQTEYSGAWNEEGNNLAQDAFKAKEDALKTGYEAQTQMNRLQAESASAEANARADFSEKSRIRRAEMQVKEAEIIAERQRMREQRQQMTEQMGPNRFFKDIGTVPTILAALFASAGALGAQWNGNNGRNYAGEAIEQAVARDMESQRAEIAAVDGNLDQVDNSLSTLYKQYGDREEAEREWQIDAHSIVENKLKAQIATAQDTNTRAQFEAQLAEVQMKKAEFIGMQNAVVGKRVSEAMTPDRVVGGAPSREQEVKALELEARARAAQDKIEGKGGSSGEAGAMARSQKNAVGAAKTALKRAQAADEKAGYPVILNTGVGGSDFSQDIGAQVKAISPILGRGLEGNAPNESTMKSIEEGLTSKSGDKRKAAYRAYLELLDDVERSSEE